MVGQGAPLDAGRGVRPRLAAAPAAAAEARTTTSRSRCWLWRENRMAGLSAKTCPRRISKMPVAAEPATDEAMAVKVMSMMRMVVVNDDRAAVPERGVSPISVVIRPATDAVVVVGVGVEIVRRAVAGVI